MPSPTDQGTGVPTPHEEPLGLRRVREVEHAARRSKEATRAAWAAAQGERAAWSEEVTRAEWAEAGEGDSLSEWTSIELPGDDGRRLCELADALGSSDRDQAAIASVFIRAAVLCLAKNRDYSSSFRAPSRLAPHVSAQDRLLARIDDKDLRFINLGADSSGDVGESRLETMRDRACYSLLWCLLEEERLSGGGGS